MEALKTERDSPLQMELSWLVANLLCAALFLPIALMASDLSRAMKDIFKADGLVFDWHIILLPVSFLFIVAYSFIGLLLIVATFYHVVCYDGWWNLKALSILLLGLLFVLSVTLMGGAWRRLICGGFGLAMSCSLAASLALGRRLWRLSNEAAAVYCIVVVFLLVALLSVDLACWG